jgi:NitT/TauT family transport system substrate-binding protein
VNAAAGLALAGAAPASHAAEPPPETRRIRLPRFAVDAACVSPMWIGEALLRGEGFDDVRYVPVDPADSLAGVVIGPTDFDMADPFTALLHIDEGEPLVALGGIHSACFELFGARGVHTIRELKGRKVGYADVGRKAFIAAVLGHVGLDPAKDVTFVDTSAPDGVRLLAEGKIDADLGFPPPSRRS